MNNNLQLQYIFSYEAWPRQGNTTANLNRGFRVAFSQGQVVTY
jgi:hypothetical protein